MQAILAGAGEQQRLFGQGLAARQQGIGEVNQQGAFANTAQAQANSQNMAQAGFGNQAKQSEFGMGLANANLTNQGRQQSIQEASFLRNLPLNEINALRSGSQVQMPQFPQYQGSNITPPPVSQNAYQSYQGQLGAYNADQAQQGQMTSGLMSIAGMAAMYF